MNEQITRDEVRQRIGADLPSAVTGAIKGLRSVERLLTEIEQSRFVDASVLLTAKPDLLSDSVEICRDLASRFDKLDWLAPAMEKLSVEIQMTYRKELEDGLDRAGVRRRGEWPTYVCNDVLRLSVGLSPGYPKLDGKTIDSSEIGSIVGAVVARSAELLDRPMDIERFVEDLRAAYARVCTEKRIPVGEYVSITRILEELQRLRADDLPNYSEQEFAVDLYRLMASPQYLRRYAEVVRFGGARGPKTGIFVAGVESDGRYLGSLSIDPAPVGGEVE